MSVEVDPENNKNLIFSFRNPHLAQKVSFTGDISLAIYTTVCQPVNLHTYRNVWRKIKSALGFARFVCSSCVHKNTSKRSPILDQRYTEPTK